MNKNGRIKRRVSFFLAVWMLLFSLTGCGDFWKERERERLYQEAIALVLEDRLTPDGRYAVSGPLAAALENATFTEAKNIIVMIGDGMGFNQLQAAEVYYADQLYQGKMAWRYLPMVNTRATSSADDVVTDATLAGRNFCTRKNGHHRSGNAHFD